MTRTDQLLELLREGLPRLRAQRALLGFDGFIDKVYAIKGIPSMDAFGDFLKQRHGMSGALELLPRGVKIGGNMPITAHALGSLGISCTGIGAVGEGKVEDIFNSISPNCTLIPVTAPGQCLALEFLAGKLMLADNSSLPGLDYAAIVAALGADNLLKLHQEAKAIAYVNWSELPHMNAIYQGLLEDVYSKLPANDEPLLFDFADCTQQETGAIKQALSLMAQMGEKRKAILSMNRNEFLHLAGVLSIDGSSGYIQHNMGKMRAACGIKHLVVRMDDKAYALAPEGFFTTDIKRVQTPRLLTGAGDNYNAGLLAALMMGGTWDQALLLGTCTASYYIQHGKSATPVAIIQYINARGNHA